MTEQNINISNNSWSPASKDFWGPNHERKVDILFITAIIGILISFFGAFFGRFNSYVDQWPLFHAFFLLVAVKKKTRLNASEIKTARLIPYLTNLIIRSIRPAP